MPQLLDPSCLRSSPARFLARFESAKANFQVTGSSLGEFGFALQDLPVAFFPGRWPLREPFQSERSYQHGLILSVRSIYQN